MDYESSTLTNGAIGAGITKINTGGGWLNITAEHLPGSNIIDASLFNGCRGEINRHKACVSNNNG